MEIMKLFINGIVFGAGWTAASLIANGIYLHFIAPRIMNKILEDYKI